MAEKQDRTELMEAVDAFKSDITLFLGHLDSIESEFEKINFVELSSEEIIEFGSNFQRSYGPESINSVLNLSNFNHEALLEHMKLAKIKEADKRRILNFIKKCKYRHANLVFAEIQNYIVGRINAIAGADLSYSYNFSSQMPIVKLRLHGTTGRTLLQIETDASDAIRSGRLFLTASKDCLTEVISNSDGLCKEEYKEKIIKEVSETEDTLKKIKKLLAKEKVSSRPPRSKKRS